MSALNASHVASSLQELVSGLVGKHFNTSTGKPLQIGGVLPVVVGTFRDDAGAVAAVMVLDVPLASFLGAGLVMIPVGVANESVKARKVSGNLLENLQEIMNVSAQLFMSEEHTHHVRFESLSQPPPAPPKDVTSLASKPNGRLDLDAELEGYGKGRITIVW